MDPLANITSMIKVILIIVAAVNAQDDQNPHQSNDAKIVNKEMPNIWQELESMKVENIKLRDQLDAIQSESNALKAANTKIMDGFMKLLHQMDAIKAENNAQKAEHAYQIIAMKEEITSMAAQMDAIKVENIAMKANHTSQMDVLKGEINVLAEQLEAEEVKNFAMKAKVASQMDDMDAEIEDTHITNSSVKMSFRKVKSEYDIDFNKISWMQSNFLSFTAFASVTRDYVDGQKVLFDSVLRNYGDYYDAVESEFVCPITAYYLFTVSARSATGNYMHAAIYMDTEFLVLAAPQAFGEMDQGSNTVVTLCEEGQVVAVYVACCGHNQMKGSQDSTFTGVLLQIV